MIPIPSLATPRNILIVLLLAACAVFGHLWQISAAGLETAVAERDAARQRVATLQQEVAQAGQVVEQAKAINGRQAAALDRHRRNMAAMQRALAAAEEAAREREFEVVRAARAARERDRMRREDPTLPAVGVMNAALRDAARGL